MENNYALNQGLSLAKYNYIAYLPSYDFYYNEVVLTFCF